MAPQVLVLGMPRTGTQSLGEALRTLGHQNVYHMTSVGPNNHHDKWVSALEAKFENTGTEFTKQDFDGLLGDFDVSVQAPTPVFLPNN
ncbi:NAD dependent epimerase/dehydratase [Venturia nashicola]|nr:NAD dependent epimerase/dehydratase [Venturia nashicola]